FPNGRTSDVQRRQMTTVDSPNVHVLAIDGTFDDCQDLVKAMFNDRPFRERMKLSAVNSINWARVMAQVVYYVTATDDLRGDISFCVPSGNFGNVFAGWIAKQMGAPIDRLVVASNANDILTRFFNDNDMSARPVVPSLSPSMDIQVSSNFERLLFEAHDRDAAAVRALMAGLSQSRSFAIAPEPLARIRRDFASAAVDEETVAQEMRRTYGDAGYLLDPHTAVGVHAGRALIDRDPRTPVIALSTAHPAKFPDAVLRATGVRPELPPHLAELMDRPERFARLANDQAAVERFIRERARVVTERAA
ncbi:MAG: threonine synthase, partial [Microvirga sp.]